MHAIPDSPKAFQTVFTSTTSGYFLREFSFSHTQFVPPDQTEVELADFVIQLDDLVMIFQVKEREEPSSDPNEERTWFEKKVIRRGTKQIRDTIAYLEDSPPQITNDRGRLISLPPNLSIASVVKVVVFKGGARLPGDCTKHRFHESRTAGFIHVIAAYDWASIMNTLVTPREIADYLGARENICRAYTTEARLVSEKSLIGQFLVGQGTAMSGEPSGKFESVVDRLAEETSSLDIFQLLHLFPDHITADVPAGTITPEDMRNADTDYYPIILEIAKLPRTDLAAFKTRFGLAWQGAGKVSDPPFMRMVASTGVGFVFAPIPQGLEAKAHNGLMNFVTAHMYDQHVTRCIGVSFVDEGSSRLISWIFVDQEWRYSPEMEQYLHEHPLSPVREVTVPRYRLDLL